MKIITYFVFPVIFLTGLMGCDDASNNSQTDTPHSESQTKPEPKLSARSAPEQNAVYDRQDAVEDMESQQGNTDNGSPNPEAGDSVREN